MGAILKRGQEEPFAGGRYFQEAFKVVKGSKRGTFYSGVNMSNKEGLQGREGRGDAREGEGTLVQRRERGHPIAFLSRINLIKIYQYNFNKLKDPWF
jgi:hypothetical protein